MISVDEALQLARDRRWVVPKVDRKLADNDETKLHYLDATIEAHVYKNFDGRIFEFRVPAQMVEPALVEALLALYQKGGWLTSAYPVKNDAGDVVEIQVIFAPTSPPPPPVATSSSATSEKLEPPQKVGVSLPPLVRAIQPVFFRGDMPRLLIRMPTRQRPIQALEVLEKYRKLAGYPVQLEVVVDEDDESMIRTEVLQRLAALDCVVTVGSHQSKVAACNGGRLREWDILVLASDDMVPLVDNYAACIVSAMEEHWPHFDGALHFNDGHQRKNLCTLPILGRRLYDQFGYVYDPAYRSLFCDREYTDVLQATGRLTYIDEKLIEHRHHVWGRAEKDALYDRNDALEEADRATFEKRKAAARPHAQFAFDSPPLWLSVLVCSVPARRAQLGRLLADLWHQIRSLRPPGSPREVEILVDDRQVITIGEKRQSLLERARGHFVAFVDDDDGVAFNYLERVVGALRASPDADCASLEGVITTAGGKPEVFRHSIAFDGWYTKDGIYYRGPNHLNSVRRELALQVGFVSKNHGEDFEYSKRVKPFLKKEAPTGEGPLYFYWYMPKSA